jgi:DNA-binding NtrC family response regulator
MDVPGLIVLRRHAPELAQRLEEFVRRLVAALDADRWAAEQVRALVEAHARGDMLAALVNLVEQQAGTGEAWAIVWNGDPSDGAVSLRRVSGHGGSPPDPEALSRTLLATVAQKRRAVWLDDAQHDPGPLGQAASILMSAARPHGAVPLGQYGAVYLAGTDSRSIPQIQRLRIEALCRVAGGFVDAAPEIEQTPVSVPGMVGRSRKMQDLARTVHGFAAVPWPVLVLGETGTGKELVARALHSLSARAAGPFVATNCAAIPEELAESTLFGHERGAFTGADRRREGLVERAAGGTLFLDEVGELSPRVQAKLLRVLQEGRFERVGGDRELVFEGRIVAATLRPLRQEDGGFRADLYHRLGACVIRVPPLRERREDLREVATHLLRRSLAELVGAPPIGLSELALAELERRDWPGNVRELDNVLKGALARAVAAGARTLGPEHLSEEASETPEAAPASGGPTPAALPDRFQLVGPQHHELLATELLPATEQLQRALVRHALGRSAGNRPQAAAHLGVSRQWLHTLLTRWGREGSG